MRSSRMAITPTPCTVILSQAQRDSVMNRFRTRNLQMLVATDVAARGIDVVDLTHIINYNLPDDIEYYTHRSGRTGRAGKSGISIVIVNIKEVFRIGQIEKQIGKKFSAGQNSHRRRKFAKSSSCTWWTSLKTRKFSTRISTRSCPPRMSDSKH